MRIRQSRRSPLVLMRACNSVPVAEVVVRHRSDAAGPAFSKAGWGQEYSR